MQTVGCGTINILVNINGNRISKQLKDVLYCPELDNNLFSLSAMRRQEFDMNTQGDRMYITKDNAVAVTAKFDGNMYLMDMKIEKREKCYSAGMNNLHTYRQRMGHVNVTTLLKTAKSDAVIGLKKVKVAAEKFQCDACSLGKQTRQQHPPVQSQIILPLEIIHSDVCGPMPTSSPSGSRYFVVFKDECTGYRTVYTMRHKLDILDLWKRFVAMAERKTANAKQRLLDRITDSNMITST